MAWRLLPGICCAPLSAAALLVFRWRWGRDYWVLGGGVRSVQSHCIFILNGYICSSAKAKWVELRGVELEIAGSNPAFATGFLGFISRRGVETLRRLLSCYLVAKITSSFICLIAACSKSYASERKLTASKAKLFISFIFSLSCNIGIGTRCKCSDSMCGTTEP